MGEGLANALEIDEAFRAQLAFGLPSVGQLRQWTSAASTYGSNLPAIWCPGLTLLPEKVNRGELAIK